MTQKLTAAKARERIEHLQTWQAQRGLTLREEEYLQALEMALRILEAVPVSADLCPEGDQHGDPYGVWVAGANWRLEQMQ